MTANRRLKENGIKGRVIVILFLFLLLKSCVVKGNAMTCHIQGYGYEADRYLLAVSAKGNSRKADKHLYLGYELALGRPIDTLNGDLVELNRLRVNSLGVTAGGVVANKFTALYHSDASLPDTFHLFIGGLSANVYLLRIGDAKYHNVEPYLLGSVLKKLNNAGNETKR